MEKDMREIKIHLYRKTANVRLKLRISQNNKQIKTVPDDSYS